MFELRYGTRSQDYSLPVHRTFYVKDNGKGEGSLIGLAKVSFGKTIQIVGYRKLQSLRNSWVWSCAANNVRPIDREREVTKLANRPRRLWLTPWTFMPELRRIRFSALVETCRLKKCGARSVKEQTSSYQSSFPMKNLMVSVALLGGIRISFFGQATNKVYGSPSHRSASFQPNFEG